MYKMEKPKNPCGCQEYFYKKINFFIHSYNVYCDVRI